MENCLCSCNQPAILPKFAGKMSSSWSISTPAINFRAIVPRGSMVCVVKALALDSHESSSDFTKRIERAWLISQQLRPVVCDSCNSNGSVESKWCAGTGFFILGDNVLYQVPSRNSTCVICAGKDRCGALTVKEQAFVPNGCRSLQSRSSRSLHGMMSSTCFISGEFTIWYHTCSLICWLYC